MPGGGECSDCAKKKKRPQRKLALGSSNDPLESEADRVADQVVSSSPSVAGAAATATPMAKHIQRATNTSGAAAGADTPASVSQTLASSGRPLEMSLRRDMEQRFGYDFSGVRVHTGASAARSADDIDAAAYTYGNNIVFAAGQYVPATADGRHLLAHELTHVVQQAGSSDQTVQRQRRRRSSSPPRGRRPATPAAAASRSTAIVDDGQPVATGQMHRTDFLQRAREALIEAADAEFRSIGRSARGCPYILRTIERYANRPAASVMRFVQAFARPPAGADAAAMLRALADRTRAISRRISARQGPRAQAKTESGEATLPAHDPQLIRDQLGGGRVLDESTRDKMEGAFGQSFASVRVHADGVAARFNSALGARAFTVGQDIAFAAGEYRPGTAAGDTLLAHELAHTVQQRNATTATRDATQDPHLERQADQAATQALSGNGRRVNSFTAAALEASELRVQRLPAVVAGAIVVAEATPEVIVVAEVASVTTEVVVVDSALVVTAEAATPVVLEAAVPATLEAAAPAALETTAAVSSSSAATSTGVLATAAAATTLSSDSPTSEDNRQRNCFERNPTALPCEEEIDIEETVQEFIMRQGYGYESLGECYGMGSVASIDACNGAPGTSYHCDVAPYSDPIARTTKPGGIVSIFSCLCCRVDGETGFEFRGGHWSPGPGR